MHRRDFLMLGGLSATSSLLAGCTMPRVQRYFVPYVERPADTIPGMPNAWATTCTACPAGCGMLAKVIEGRAIKLEGNPAHPVNQGKLCALGQAGLQALYHPDRIRQPLRRKGKRGAGDFEPISWDDALASLVTRLRPLVGTGAVDVVIRPLNGSRGLVLDRFTRAVAGRGPVALAIQGDETLLEAYRGSFGFERLPFMDLANARCVLNFGAEIFTTWGSPVNQGVQYGRFRQGRPGIRGTLIHVSPRMAPEGATADRWIPLRPGTEGLMALSLAQVILEAGLATPGFEGWHEALAAYSPEAVSPRIGVPPATIRELGRAFASQRPSLAIAGGPMLAQPEGLRLAQAIQILNHMVGSAGIAGGLLPNPPSLLRDFNAMAPARFQDVRGLVSRMQGGQLKALLVHDVDPAYLLPARMGFVEALDRVPLLVSFNSYLDDTTALADLILPDHVALESWGILTPEPAPGVPVLSSMQPVVAPVFETRPVEDVLISVGRALGGAVSRSLNWGSYSELVQASWVAVGGEALWVAARREGLKVGSPPAAVPISRRPIALPALAQGSAAPDEFPYYFYPYLSQSLHDGRGAHLPWLQELPDAMTTGAWSSWVEIHPDTAGRLGLTERDPVLIRSTVGSLLARVHLQPGVHPEVLAMPMGQGHRQGGRYAAGRGANPLAIVEPIEVVGTGALAWAGTRVSLSRAAEAPPFIKVERQILGSHDHSGPGYVALEDLRRQRWPWDGTAEATP